MDFQKIWNSVLDVLNNVANAIIFLLPDSPFKTIEVPVEIKNLLGYVNYYIPMAQIVAIVSSWAGCVGIYYIYRAILRWVKVD